MSRVHKLRAGVTIRGYLLRVLLFAILVVASFALIEITWLRAIALVLAVIGAVRPDTFCAWLAIALLVLGMLGGSVELWNASLAIFTVHAGHVVGALTITIPPLARVQLRALLPTVLRFLWIQALSQMVQFTIFMLLLPASGIGFAWLAPIGAATLLGLFALLRFNGKLFARHAG